jgi:hypothetical protein
VDVAQEGVNHGKTCVMGLDACVSLLFSSRY